MKQHAKVIRLEISIGADDSERTIEDFMAAISTALKSAPVNAHNVTPSTQYYLIDGSVCLPSDYDPKKRTRKPGTYAPVWAGGPKPVPEKPKSDPEDDAPREFVRVKPTRSNEINPKTGRRYRSDRGKARGPREQKASA